MPPIHADLAWNYARTRLERELDSRLSYHSLTHTADDVVPAATRLAAIAELSEEQAMLLITAAWYHDLGHIQQYAEHELISVRIATEVLPTFGYTSAHIECVIGMILATRLPQLPANQLEALLADADLDSLGRADFLETSRALQNELAARGLVTSDLGWYEQQRRFLVRHRYHTRIAAELRNAQKQENIRLLGECIRRSECDEKHTLYQSGARNQTADCLRQPQTLRVI